MTRITSFLDFGVLGEQEINCDCTIESARPARTQGDPNACHPAEGGVIVNKVFWTPPGAKRSIEITEALTEERLELLAQDIAEEISYEG